MIKAVLFDFGGVLAEEGFRKGLMLIAEKNGLDPSQVFKTAEELIYDTGYVLGLTDEFSYLNALRKMTGIREDNKTIKEEVLGRFVLRPEILKIVGGLRKSGLITAILSDQTNWLEELNEKTPFFHHFDYVFNSFHLKKGKRDSSIFRDVSSLMNIRPQESVFIDDNIKNIERAATEGLNVIHFRGMASFKEEMRVFVNI